MRRAALAGALALTLLAGAAWGQGVLRSQSFADSLAAGECPKDKDALNEALKRPDAELLVLAGWMSQWGVCMAANPDNAWRFYERAHAMGAPSAAARLAGLAATSAGGADVAAVLWWARKTVGEKAVGLGDCDPLPGRKEASDSEFVDALKSWPQERLHRCRSEVGFSAMMVGEVHYPLRALRSDQQGSVSLEYELQTGQVTARSSTDPVDVELVRYIERTATRAIGALPRPPHPTRGSLTFVFRTTP